MPILLIETNFHDTKAFARFSREGARWYKTLGGNPQHFVVRFDQIAQESLYQSGMITARAGERSAICTVSIGLDRTQNDRANLARILRASLQISPDGLFVVRFIPTHVRDVIYGSEDSE